MKNRRILTAFFVFMVISALSGGEFSVSPIAFAASNDLQAQIDADNQQIAELNRKIAEYQAQLNQLGADKKTLQAAIKSLDLQKSQVETQISVTQRQINSTQLQLQQLGGQIDDTRQEIEMDKGAIAKALQNIQQADNQPLIVQVLASDNLSDFWRDMDATLQAQTAIRDKTHELQMQEKNLSDTQAAAQEKEDALAAQKKSLASQQQSLNVTVKSKNDLLTQTKAQESNYQKLLAQAQAELESYSKFTQNAGGANLLTNQTVCDDWGCYYNQRDAAWGGRPLNGTKYTLASDGCLVTAMAMVMTHYGYRSVTPATINANPANFASYYPAYLLYTITAAGVTATRKTAAIDATLATGNPVVIGLNAYGGTHFVVLVSGSNGNYVMRDPYVANGKDIKFSSYYSVKNIYSISKVVIEG
ncbi:MAG TPA: C39 family peptidase [Candidatus Paceibacterota bacterium]|nr:C39 family peptidase [Candidatus Paceibacterota bacterium]